MFTTVAGAAKALSVSERHLYRLIEEGKIPFYRLSPRTTRLDVDELRDFMRFVAEGGPVKKEAGR